MNKKRKTLVVGLILLLVSLLTAGIASMTLMKADATSNNQTARVPGQVRNFTLYVRGGYIKMADGQKIFVFGYTDNPQGGPKVPGPTLVVNEGDTVNVAIINDQDPTNTKYNKGGDGHTIHLHGLDLPSAMDGDPMTAPGGHGVMQGHSFTYHFVAQYPGTFWYHCHVEATEHIQMGMYGALIIRPNGQPHRAYPDTPVFDKEYTFVLSEMDSAGHQTDYQHLYNGGPDENWNTYHPNYFLINGKAWPDTMMDPQDSITGTVGQTVLVRLINSGYQVHSMHSHGFHFLVIGSDGRRLDNPYYKDTIDIAPGERYDIIFVLNQPGRYMFHDHVEMNTTNNGMYLGGMLTMINVNNPDGSNPVPMQQMMSSK